jgi:hypothetical protein
MSVPFKTITLIAALIGAAPAYAQAMPLPTFLAKAAALEKKGAMALFSGDLKRLKAEMRDSAAALRVERLAAVKAGKRPAYCPPEKGAPMNSDEVLAYFRSIPAAQRAQMTTKDGLRGLVARKHPCPA